MDDPEFDVPAVIIDTPDTEIGDDMFRGTSVEIIVYIDLKGGTALRYMAPCVHGDPLAREMMWVQHDDEMWDGPPMAKESLGP